MCGSVFCRPRCLQRQFLYRRPCCQAWRLICFPLVARSECRMINLFFHFQLWPMRPNPPFLHWLFPCQCLLTPAVLPCAMCGSVFCRSRCLQRQFLYRRPCCQMWQLILYRFFYRMLHPISCPMMFLILVTMLPCHLSRLVPFRPFSGHFLHCACRLRGRLRPM